MLNFNGVNSGAGPQAQAMSAAQAAYLNNIQARRLIVHGDPVNNIPPAVDMWQPLIIPMPASIAPGVQLNVPLRNVGLIKRVVLEIAGTFTAGASTTSTLTKLGLANLFSNVIFYDLANNIRLNTTGWHLIVRSSANRRKVWGAAVTTDTPFGYGNNYVVNKTAATISANGTSAFRVFFECPFVRTDDDLRGVIFGDTTMANMQLTVTFNPNMFVTSTQDATGAVYQSGGTDLATISSVTVTAYQNYLDQGPQQKTAAGNVPLIPQQDVGTAYVLNQTTTTLPVANQLNATNFINQRQFLSLVLIYDNAGALNAGTDITFIQIASANFTLIRNLDPYMQALMGRVKIADDFPVGMYYLDFSDRPLDTVQYGNMQMLFQPSNVGGSTAVVLLGYEAYGTIGQINVGASLASGAGG